MPAIIEVANLKKEFKNEIKTVDGPLLHCIIQPGLWIPGTEWAGKSPTIRLLLTLIKPGSGHIACETNMGILRLSLTKSVSRTQYMMMKFSASAVYTILLLVWLAMLALFGGMFVFDTNDMVVLRSEGIEQIQQFDVLWRYFAVLGYAVALTIVAALSFLLSVFAENSIGPIITTMRIVIVFTILPEMNMPIYDKMIKPPVVHLTYDCLEGFFLGKSN